MITMKRNSIVGSAAVCSLFGLSQAVQAQTNVIGLIEAGFVNNQIQIIIHNDSSINISDSMLTGFMLDGPLLGTFDTVPVGPIAAHSKIVIGSGSVLCVPFGMGTDNNPASNPDLDYDFGVEFTGTANNSLYLAFFSPTINSSGSYIDFEGVQNQSDFAPVPVAEILDPVSIPESGSLASLFAMCSTGALLINRRR